MVASDASRWQVEPGTEVRLAEVDTRSTDGVPADRKWYRNWAISRILVETVEDMDPKYPAAEGDDMNL